MIFWFFFFVLYNVQIIYTSGNELWKWIEKGGVYESIEGSEGKKHHRRNSNKTIGMALIWYWSFWILPDDWFNMDVNVEENQWNS